MTSYPCTGKAMWDLRTAKLAVAVAIIKSKPPGVSGRQHAEILAARLKKQEESWKAKAEDLKEEVLQLRQELLLTKLLSNPRKSAEAEHGDDVVKLLSQDPTDAQLSESDSGCGTCNNTQTLHPTPDLLDVPTPCHSSTVPSSSIHSSHSRVTFPCRTGSLEHALSKRMQFLQHLSGLRRWSGPALVVDGDGAVVWDSVLYLLSSVIEAFKEARGNKALPDAPLLLQASRVAAQALEQGRPSAQHLGQMEDSVKELLDLLLSNSELNKFAAQKTLTECLISLGGSSTFRSVLVRLLLSHVNHLAGHLWTSCQGSSDGQQQQQQVDWSRYENSIYLFCLLEQLAVVGQGRGAETEHRDLQAQLERYVLPLSDEFPLFALYLWRIGALFNPTSTAGTSAQSFSSQSTFNP